MVCLFIEERMKPKKEIGERERERNREQRGEDE